MNLKVNKICSRCKQAKSADCFNKNKHKADGLQTLCKECGRQKSKAYYNSNKEKHKQTTVARKKKHILTVQQYILNLMTEKGCIDCREHDPCVLEFDHLRDKKYNISYMISRGFSLSNILQEITKCEIRCANCHRRKTAREQNWYKYLVK